MDIVYDSSSISHLHHYGTALKTSLTKTPLERNFQNTSTKTKKNTAVIETNRLDFFGQEKKSIDYSTIMQEILQENGTIYIFRLRMILNSQFMYYCTSSQK